MSIDLTVPRSRRALLGAVVGGLAATAANAIGRPAAALATDGQPILQGVDNSGSASTVVRSNTTTSLQGVTDATTGAHAGVRGRSSSASGFGVLGVAAATTGGNVGVLGTSASGGGTGVRGEAPSRGVDGRATASSGPNIGVYGFAVSPGGFGVYGKVDNSSISTYGVYGEAAGFGTYGVGNGNNSVGARGVSLGDGNARGVEGFVSADTGIAVLGHSTSNAPTTRAIVGRTAVGCGVHGWIGPIATLIPPNARANTAVEGRADVNTGSLGVLGRSTGGTGVRGLTTSGTGVLAEAANASAIGLRVIGKAAFSRSGKATVLTGNSAVTVAGNSFGSTSLVLATIQGAGAAGLYVRNVSVNTSTGQFTIRLSQNVAANTIVGWFIAN